MTQRFEGKITVITGGNSGIGLATAKQFVNEGAYVFITGRRQKELDEAVKAIGQNVTGVQGDVAKLADVDRLYEIVKANGRIDILFANAGIAEFAALGKITEEHFDKLFNINVKGTLFTVQKALPLLNDGSSIILTGSVGSVKGTPAFGVYGATKAALIAFTNSLNREEAQHGVRATAISPAFVATRMTEWTGLPGEEQIQPDDIATLVRAVLTLSPKARVPNIVVERMGDTV
jgi:NAD(P)-dependent dehydrogenase (short-subunit alcohol dehydrogenase family)